MAFIDNNDLKFLKSFNCGLPGVLRDMAGPAHGIPAFKADAILCKAYVFQDAQQDDNL